MKFSQRVSVLLVLILSLPRLLQGAPLSDEQKIIHVLNRLSLGLAPGDIEMVKAAGVESYIQQQLNPSSIALPGDLSQKLSRLESLKKSPGELVESAREAARNGKSSRPEDKSADKKDNNEARKARKEVERAVLNEAMTARLLRAVESPRQLEEVMTDFWFNHFNVYSQKGPVGFWVGLYEQTIRDHAFGKFRDLLESTARHPAMVFYLDNALNTAPDAKGAKGKKQGLNENYARELMELHTLGVDGGYTQKDVVELARILTGWGLSIQQGGKGKRREVRATDPSGFSFDKSRHDMGDKVFLGHTIKGRGEAEVEEALDILARHPSTAKRVGFKLAQYFVADNPPEVLVTRLAETFTKTDGDIKQVLSALFASPEFLDSAAYQAKFKTPYHYIVSAVRSSGRSADNLKPLVAQMREWGMPLYGCLTPDGYKNTADKWMNPDAMVKRINFATQLASGKSGQGKREGKTKDPVDAVQLEKILGSLVSAKTKEAMTKSADQLDAALILGSPEFVKF